MAFSRSKTDLIADRHDSKRTLGPRGKIDDGHNGR